MPPVHCYGSKRIGNERFRAVLLTTPAPRVSSGAVSDPKWTGSLVGEISVTWGHLVTSAMRQLLRAVSLLDAWPR